MSSHLIHPETVFVIDAEDQKDVFAQAYDLLKERGLVKEGFLQAIIAREERFPTGMDMTPIDPSWPSFAIPHTDPDYVCDTRVVPIKLVNPVQWASITDASVRFPVSFLFMILNGGTGDSQTQVLAKIMDFVNGIGAQGAARLFALTDTQEIHDALRKDLVIEG